MAWRHLQVSKKDSHVDSLSVARDWANVLVRRESRGSGDTENAMRRLEARYGIPWRVFWSLRYRPPRDLLLNTFLQLRAAYLHECERQQALLQHEIAVAKAKGAFVEDLAIKASGLVANDMDL